MPFWEKFKRKEVPQVKGLGTHSSNSLPGGAEFSLQSFGLKLLQQESSVKLKQNVFISPISIFLALAMTENGASGETKTAMRKVLTLPTDASAEAGPGLWLMPITSTISLVNMSSSMAQLCKSVTLE